MNHIWMYWEDGGRGMPPFVKLCMESVRRNSGGAQVHLLDQKSIREWYQLRKAAHRADYIRTRLVLQHGGIWLDSDMVALSSLEPLLDIPEHHDFACQDIGSAIGCFAARQGCALLSSITAEQDVALDRNLHDFPWNGIGNDLLKQFGEGYAYHRWQKWTIDEIAGGKVTKLLSESERMEDNIDRHAVVFHFCGNLLAPLLDVYANHRQRSLLKQRMLMSRILRRCLGVGEPGLIDRFTDPALYYDLDRAVCRQVHRAPRERATVFRHPTARPCHA